VSVPAAGGYGGGRSADDGQMSFRIGPFVVLRMRLSEHCATLFQAANIGSSGRSVALAPRFDTVSPLLVHPVLVMFAIFAQPIEVVPQNLSISWPHAIVSHHLVQRVDYFVQFVFVITATLQFGL
jgi:hypothetical protein